MKKLSFIVLTGAILFCSCGNGENDNKNGDTSVLVSNKDGEVMVQQPDTSAKSANPTVDDKAAEFVKDAAHAGMKEVELGKWAQEYGTRKEVKDFAAMMVADHTAAGEELRKIAGTKNVVAPVMVPDNVRDNIDKMKTKKQGTEVDKAYVNEMVDDHRKAVDMFEDAAKDLTDADLRNFASKTLPALRKHYDMIKAIKDKM